MLNHNNAHIGDFFGAQTGGAVARGASDGPRRVNCSTPKSFQLREEQRDPHGREQWLTHGTSFRRHPPSLEVGCGSRRVLVPSFNTTTLRGRVAPRAAPPHPPLLSCCCWRRRRVAAAAMLAATAAAAAAAAATRTRERETRGCSVRALCAHAQSTLIAAKILKTNQ